jgi:hypothetical protein
MTGLRYFRAEIDAHLVAGECPAGVCHPIAVPADRRPTASATSNPATGATTGAPA